MLVWCTCIRIFISFITCNRQTVSCHFVQSPKGLSCHYSRHITVHKMIFKEIELMTLSINTMKICLSTLHACHNAPQLDQNRADAVLISLIMVKIWNIMACVQGNWIKYYYRFGIVSVCGLETPDFLPTLLKIVQLIVQTILYFIFTNIQNITITIHSHSLTINRKYKSKYIQIKCWKYLDTNNWSVERV